MCVRSARVHSFYYFPFVRNDDNRSIQWLLDSFTLSKEIEIECFCGSAYTSFDLIFFFVIYFFGWFCIKLVTSCVNSMWVVWYCNVFRLFACGMNEQLSQKTCEHKRKVYSPRYVNVELSESNNKLNALEFNRIF